MGMEVVLGVMGGYRCFLGERRKREEGFDLGGTAGLA